MFRHVESIKLYYAARVLKRRRVFSQSSTRLRLRLYHLLIKMKAYKAKTFNQ